MSYFGENARPNSARPQSRMNPITGEEMPYSARESGPMSVRGTSASTHGRGDNKPRATTQHQPQQQQQQQQASHFQYHSRPENRPQGVPKLHLDKITGPDDDPDLTLHMDPYNYKLTSPGPESAVSWGTPTSLGAQRHQQQQQSHRQSSRQPQNGAHGQTSARNGGTGRTKQPSAWDVDQVVPENLRPPSQRHRDQYAQLEQDVRDSYRQHSKRSLTESEVLQQIADLRLDVPQYDAPEDDDARDDIQKTWTNQPYSKAAQIRKSDKETLEEENRKKKLLETVLIDQLSRPVISVPAQGPPLSSRPLSFRPGKKRGTARPQDSSRISNTTTPTENLLSRRVQFGARVITRVGRDAIRELTGFFFAVDNSLTVYEFKKFGKTAKALPFVKRGVYEHVRGGRRGEPYTLTDIKQGDCLVMATKDQPVPDSMKVADLMTLKVTHVDDDAKAAILFEDVPVQDQDDIWRRAHLPRTQPEMDARVLLIEVQDCVRSQIRSRGLKVFTGLYNQYLRADLSGLSDGDGRLNRVELEKGLIDYHIDLPQEKFDDLWEQLDVESTSFLDYGEFMRAYLGEMSESRKALVRKAFWKIDPSKRGEVTPADIRKFYNAYKHPRVKNRECTEADIIQSFLSHFEGDVITYAAFENYYEGLSVCVTEEEDFVNILQNAWSI